MASSSSRVKSVQNLQDLRSFCLGNTQSLRHKKGFVKYNYQLCQAPRLSAAAVVDNNINNYSTDNCSSNSTTSISNTNASVSIFPKKKRMVDKEEGDISGKVLDQWVKGSIVEILNNIDEAPFLVCIYSDGEEVSSSTSKTRLVSEKAAAESWPILKGRWGEKSPTPSGIILVEEMSSEDAVVGADGLNLGSSSEMMMMDNDSSSCSDSTKVWGILIQGKGLSFPACYILKTCRVRSVSGFCTHFCLVRVKCFLETVDIQLKKLWLV